MDRKSVVTPWCRGYHCCTTSFNKAWTQVRRKFKSCSRRVGDSRWWESLTMVPAGNKAKRLLSVNHTAKTIYHLHHYGFIEKSNGNNYLAFSSTVDNKKALEKYIKRWSKIKNPISKINNNSGKNEIDFMKSNLIQITMYLLIEW